MKMSSLFDLAGRVAVVTGGNGGIGRGIALGLAEAGAAVAFFGSGLIPSYSAAKGAIVQLTKSMAIELAPHNIQVNAIAPGWIETDMTAPVKTMPLNDEILLLTPAGRWGQAEDVAGTAVYLASRASDFVTVLQFLSSMAAMRSDELPANSTTDAMICRSTSLAVHACDAEVTSHAET